MIQFAAFDGVGIGDHNPGALPLRDDAGCCCCAAAAAGCCRCCRFSCAFIP